MDWINLVQHRAQWRFRVRQAMSRLNSTNVRELFECHFSDQSFLSKILLVLCYLAIGVSSYFLAPP
jgi:hypothetical protein